MIKTLKKIFTRDRILAFIVIFLLLRYHSCVVKEKNGKIAETQIWKDKYGNEHARVQELLLDKQQMKEKVDSISEVLDIRPKQVVRYVKVGAKIDTVVKPTVTEVVKTDTIRTDSMVYIVREKDVRINFDDSPHLSIKGKPDSLQIGINADIIMTDYYKRRKFLGIGLGKKIDYTDIGTNNPYIRITNAEAFRKITKPKLKIRPGIGLGLNIDPVTGQVHTGFQVGIYLIRSP